MIFSFLLPPIIHELGHFIAALLFGKRIKFKFSLGKVFGIPVPRWTWKIPSGLTRGQVRFVSQAGFLSEFACAVFFPATYLFVACLHFGLYPWYAGTDNDFLHY